MLFLVGIVTLQLIAATQHAFIHPGTLFPIVSIEQLGSTINNPDPMVQQAKNDLVNFTWHSLSQPPNARSEVRVVFNPGNLPPFVYHQHYG